MIMAMVWGRERSSKECTRLMSPAIKKGALRHTSSEMSFAQKRISKGPRRPKCYTSLLIDWGSRSLSLKLTTLGQSDTYEVNQE